MTDKPLNQILYAEDETDIRAIAQVALEDIGGLTVKYCRTGREALEAAKLYTPDLLLLDVMMPEMDGPTALQEIRKIPGLEHIPVIFMTAKVQQDEISKYILMGALDVISKPFDPLLLSETIKNIWKKSHTE